MAGKRAALAAGAALAGALAWLPLTSAALHAAVPWTTPPSLTMPVPAYFYWRVYGQHPTLRRWLPPCAVGSGMVALAPAILALCMPMRRRLRPGRPGDPVPEPERALSDTYGSAHWMPWTEARRWFPGGDPGYGGVVLGQLGEAGDAPLLVDRCDSDATHGLVFAGSGGGKAQPLDAAVLTPTGFRRIGDLRVGDLVQSPEGHPIRVTGVYPQGEKDIYRLIFRDGRTVESCDEHLWKVWTRTSERSNRPGARWERAMGWRVLPLSAIRQRFSEKRSMWKATAMPVVEPFAIEFPTATLPVPPYTMGCLLGDGNFTGDQVGLSTADPYLLDRVLAELPDYRAVATNKYDYRFTLADASSHNEMRNASRVRPQTADRFTRGGYCGRGLLLEHDGVTKTVSQWSKELGLERHHIRNRMVYLGWTAGEALGFDQRVRPDRTISPLKRAIRDLGLKGVCSQDKFIPDIYKRGSVAQRLALLQGLLDTDGSVEGKGSTFASFSSSSLRLAKDVREVVWSLGGIARIAPRSTHFAYLGVKKAGLPSWRVSIVHPSIPSLFSLPRKVLKCRTKTMRHRLNVVSIEPVGRKPAVCISVGSPDGLYVTNDYVVTHNTAGVTIPTLDPTVGWRGSVVVFDPSCEVGPKTSGMRIAAGHRVVTLAPGAQGMNVLDWIDPADMLAEAHVHTVIETIGPDREAASGDNAIFIIQGKNLQVCLLADMIWTPEERRGDEPEHERTLRRFAHRMSTPEDDMKRLLQDIHDGSRSAMARRLAGTLMGIHPKTFSSIYANAQADIAWLHTAAHAAVVSGSDLRTDALADGHTTVYVQIPMATLQDTPALGRTVINALLQGVYRQNGRTNGRILFLLDEVNLLGEMKALAIARDNARKYGVTLVPMWQSLGQLAGTWKDGGKSAWMESSSWQMFAAVNHEHTAKEVSERCGTYTVLARTENTSRGSSGGRGGGSSRNQSAGLSEQARALIRPEEIQTRMRRDERIVFRRGGSGPLRCNAALWFKRPEMAARIGA